MVETQYEFQPWGEWRLRYTKTTGVQVYIRSRMGRQIHIYADGRREVTSWHKYEQTKTVYPSDYAETSQGRVPPQTAQDVAGTEIVTPVSPSIREQTIKGGSAEDVGGQFPMDQPSAPLPPITGPEEALAAQGITPETFHKFKEVTIPSARGTGYHFEGKTFYPAKGDTYEDVVQHLTWRSSFVGRSEARATYAETKTVPPDIQQQIDVPPSVSDVPRAKELYVTLAYEQSLGIHSPEEVEDIFQKQFPQLITGMPDTDEPGGEIWWYKKHGRFGVVGEKTWSEIQQEAPGAEIEIREGKPVILSPEEVALKQQKEKIRPLYDEPSVEGFLHTWTTGVLSWEDPLGLKSLYYTFTGDREKIIETKARASLDLDKSLKEGVGSYVIKVATGPIATVGITYGITTGIGAGVGAFKATALGSKLLLISRGVTALGKPLYTITAGKILETGIGVGFGYMVAKETAPVVIEAMDTKDYARLFSHSGMLAILGITGYKGYRTGHAIGYGATEAYLYKVQHYKPGSAERIQFEQAIRVSKLLKDVQSHKVRPLQFAKDIMRLDPKAAGRVLSYLKQHPRTTIGGSAASYTQIVGARQPRDIDVFVHGKGKTVTKAKLELKPLKTKTGQHMIDIHGTELYKPGRYYRFGFRSKDPIKIDGYRYFRGGEQTFRKGITSVITESKYRWFKDRPDFIIHSESLISSLKIKIHSPFAQIRAGKAETALQLFLHPEKHPKYGIKQPSIFEGIIKTTIKPGVEPKPVYIPSIEGYEYIYPSYVYPSKILPIPYTSYPTQQPYYQPITDISIKPYDIPDIPHKYTITPEPPISYPTYPPPEQPSIYPTYPTTEQPPIYQITEPPVSYPTYPPPEQPPSYIPPYKPPEYPSTIIIVPPPEKRKKKFDLPQTMQTEIQDKQGYEVWVKDRYIFHGKKRKEETFRKLSPHPLTANDALSLGGTLTDMSAAQTFKIKPVDEKPRKLKLRNILPWNILQYKFNEQKPNMFVEQRSYAIDTTGEFEDITAQGILTRLQQESKQQRKSPQGRAERMIRGKRLVQPIKTGEIQTQIDRMMKRVGLHAI
jgi:hypothetical protein